MPKVQQDVIIYKDSAFSTAQKHFEKDLRKRQQVDWKLVSITPTRTTFGHTRQLTAIYEREDVHHENASPNQVSLVETEYEAGAVGKQDTKRQDGVWSRIKENTERAREKEQEYQRTLAPEQLRKRKRRNTAIGCGTITVALMLCIGISIAANTNDQSTTAQTAVTSASTPLSAVTPTPHSSPAPTPTPKPTATPSPTPIPYAHFSDGTFVIGKDIQPGTYRTREASSGCYYARLKGFGGTLGEINANNNTDNPAIVTIFPTDAGFQSNNCGTWTKDLSAITTSPTSFDDGMYIVRTDIQPGTYKSSGQTGCYYARLSGFSNTTDDIIANNNTDTPAIITIATSDKGFQSNNCGTWTKQ
ncbi:MAG: hypothetical protein ABI234_01645 [Ktedonobacteraceae bacterium]